MKSIGQITKRCLVGLLFGILIGTLPSKTLAADYYVSPNGSNTGAHDSWSTAYTNIQNALNAAAIGDNVYLAGQTFVLTNQLVWAAKTNVSIRGGYAATNDMDQPGNSNPTLWPTVITRNPAYTNRLLLVTNVTAGTLEGITLSGGYNMAGAYGGGVYIAGSTGLLLSACIIQNNLATKTVGGTVARGGGIYSTASSVIVSNCLVKGNTAIGGGYEVPSGGGVYINGGTMILRDSIIAGNQCLNGTYLYGGGIYNAGGICRMRNCLVLGNSTLSASGASGAGLYLTGTTIVENCTVAYNNGQGINRASGTVAVTNSIIWGNGVDIVGNVLLGWSCSGNGVTNGVNGCLNANPLLEYGCYLATNSPCVDAGTNTAAFWGAANNTTRTDGTGDQGVMNLGYHYPAGFDVSLSDVFVATNGADQNGGTSWSAAFRTVTKALSVARDGTRIHVGPGSYTGGLETFPLTIANMIGVQILGSDPVLTVINASGRSNRVMTIKDCSGVSVEKVTLTGGAPTNHPDNFGGGVYLYDCTRTLLSGCIITNNIVTKRTSGTRVRGGGIYSIYSGVTISNCQVVGNTSSGGGSEVPNGGGIYVDADIAHIVALYNSILANNQCTGGTARSGGGLYNAGNCWLRNCLVVSNAATGGLGSGFYLSGTTSVENCTVVYNASQGIYRASGVVAVTNSIVWGNGDDLVGTMTLGYSNIEDGDSNGVNGCISADPLFVNVTASDYRLMKTSPCANSGINLGWMEGAFDLGGLPRIGGQVVDMGAYEYAVPLKGPVYRIR